MPQDRENPLEAASTQQPRATERSRITVQIDGDVDQLHTHHYEASLAVAANDDPDSLGDEQHEALMREQKRRDEFKTLTGGIDEWRPRRMQLQRLITDYELDPVDVGVLYKHGYLTFNKIEVLSLNRSRAPLYGAALLFVPGNIPAFIFAWLYLVVADKQVSMLAFLMFAAWFSFVLVASGRITRRWFIARRVGRRMDRAANHDEGPRPCH